MTPPLLDGLEINPVSKMIGTEGRPEFVEPPFAGQVGALYHAFQLAGPPENARDPQSARRSRPRTE